MGITQLEYELQQRLKFSQAMLQFSVPELIKPDPNVLEYSSEQILERYGIEDFNPVIHKNDLMFQHHLRKMPLNLSQALFHYYNVGLDALKKSRDHLPELEPGIVLDFGAGYGRGSRFLKHFFPGAEIYVSEIKPGALKFQAEQFSYQTIFHSENARSFITDVKFDLILAVSVFSHLPETGFKEWLRLLSSRLNDGGSMIFTYNQLSSEKGGGYKFIPQSEDLGLDWVPDRIKEADTYGSAFYSQARLSDILNGEGLRYEIISSFSGSQSAVILFA